MGEDIDPISSGLGKEMRAFFILKLEGDCASWNEIKATHDENMISL